MLGRNLPWVFAQVELLRADALVRHAFQFFRDQGSDAIPTAGVLEPATARCPVANREHSCTPLLVVRFMEHAPNCLKSRTNFALEALDTNVCFKLGHTLVFATVDLTFRVFYFRIFTVVIRTVLIVLRPVRVV